MAKKINSEDIFEKGLLDVLVKEIEKAEDKLDKFSEHLKGIGATLKKELGDVNLKSLDSIQKILDKTKELQKATDDAYKLEKEKIKLAHEKQMLEEKLANTKKKYQLDEEQRLKKIAEREEKRLAKEKKNADDLANAYKQLEKNTRELKNESKKLGAEMLELEKSGKKNTQAYRDLERQYKEVTKSALEGDKALKKLDKSVGDNFRSVGTYEKAVGGLKNALIQLGFAFGTIEIGKYFVDTQVKLDSLRLALQNVSGSTKEYQANFAFLRGISQAYGQDLLRLIDTYKNFIASTNESNLTLSQRKRIYESIVKAGSALALSNDDVQGTLRAVQQMFSKGTVQAEELRQQLGDRLPGAFGIMAKAVGVSEAELGKMMKNGEILTDDVMPKFAILLEEEFGKKASRNLQTLSGSFNVLKTNLTLYFDKAQSNLGVNKLLSSLILGLANNIGFLLKNLTDLGIAIATYKALMLGAEIRTATLGKSFSEVAKGAFSAKDGVSAFGISLRSITFVAVIDGLVKLTEYFIELAEGTDQARNAYEKYKNASRTGNEQANLFLLKEQKKVYSEIDKLKKAGAKDDEVKLKRQELELKRLENIKQEVRRLNNLQEIYEKKREEMRSKYGDIKPSKLPLGKAFRELMGSKDATPAELLAQEAFQGTALEFKAESPSSAMQKYKFQKGIFDEYSKYGAVLDLINTKILMYNQELEKNKILNEGSSKGNKKVGNDVAQHTKKVVDLNTKYKETNIYLSQQVELLKEIDRIMQESDMLKISNNVDNIISESSNQIQRGAGYNKLGVETAIDEETVSRFKLSEKKYIEIQQDRRNKAEQIYKNEKDAILEQEQDKLDKLKKLEDDYIRLKTDNDVNLKKKLSKASTQEAKEMKDKLLKDNVELSNIRKEIEDGKQKELAVVEENKKKRDKDVKTQEKADLLKHTNEMNNIEIEGVKKKQKTIEQLDMELAEYRLEQIKKIATSTNDLLQMALEAYVKNVESKINRLEDRMNRLINNQQYLQDKAIAGNITAQESLAKAQKDQLDMEKQKANYQRSIQRLQMAMAIFNAYNNNIQNAKVGENAFAKTITDVSALSAFVSSLPQFYTGTETDVADALGQPHLQGKDGYIVRVDGAEKILNPYLSAKTGSLTTNEIASIAEDRLKGRLMYSHEGATAKSSWENIALLNEIKDLKNIIKTKPETNIAMGEIIGGVMKIVETTKTNNTTTRNIHRFNKNI